MPPVNEATTKRLEAITLSYQPTKEPRKFLGSVDERVRRVMEIWNRLPKPNRKYPTNAEQLAYLQGLSDMGKLQTDYDQLLRDEGLRT